MNIIKLPKLSDPRGNLTFLQRVHLNRGYEGLYLPPNTWRHLENFSTNSVTLHISSSVYSEEDYIRDISKLE